MSTDQSVRKLIALVEERKFLEAIEGFYAENATMQENQNPPRAGLPALLENERQVLAHFREIRISRADSFVVEGDRAAINWIFEFVDAAGRTMHRNEIAYQLWQDGKIVSERFFYDPSA